MDGHVVASIKFGSDMKVRSLTGPSDEVYTKKSDTDDGGSGDPVVVVGGPAPTLDSGLCANVACAECREHSLDTDPTVIWYECVDTTEYRYGNKCGRNANKDKCATDADTYCHKSHPHGDTDKYQSVDAACRTVP